MSIEQKTWLCEGCPGQNNTEVNIDSGKSKLHSTDSFRDARHLYLQEYGYKGWLTTEQAAEEVILCGLQYYISEKEGYTDIPADPLAANQGALCGELIAKGLCSKTIADALAESDINFDAREDFYGKA